MSQISATLVDIKEPVLLMEPSMLCSLLYPHSDKEMDLVFIAKLLTPAPTMGCFNQTKCPFSMPGPGIVRRHVS